MEARQAFKHRKAEVFVDNDCANNVWGLAHLETLQVSFAHMREPADDRQRCLTIYIPESVTKLAYACQVPTVPGDERPPDLFLTGLEHLQNLKMLELSDQGDCVGLTLGGMEGLSALQNLQELRIAKASVSGLSHAKLKLPVLQRVSVIDCTAVSWIMDFTQCKQLTQVILLRNSCLVQIPACVKSLNFAYYGLNYMEKNPLRDLSQLDTLVVQDLRVRPVLNDRHYPVPHGKPDITQELLQNVQQVPNHYARWTWWNIDPFVSEPSDICSIKNRKNIELLRDYGATDTFENDVFDCSLQQGHGCINGFSF